ncbi:hypothetical protein PENTCL1PPCAC_28760, partial [Pristionchus entomophagus]
LLLLLFLLGFGCLGRLGYLLLVSYRLLNLLLLLLRGIRGSSLTALLALLRPLRLVVLLLLGEDIIDDVDVLLDDLEVGAEIGLGRFVRGLFCTLLELVVV